jgi:predicted Fe-Mo cluster-binding NifX family protein
MVKIAAVTENHHKLSSHFGRAPFYHVFEVENGTILTEEKRSKPYHGQQGEHDHQGHHHAHGHADLFAPIQDCRVLLCGGMGGPAYQKALAAGLEVVLTAGEIQSVLQAYLNGEVVSDMRRIHRH